jgi:hypothetical protein
MLGGLLHPDFEEKFFALSGKFIMGNFNQWHLGWIVCKQLPHLFRTQALDIVL